MKKMDEIPKELEESQLRLEVVIDPDGKFLTMKTHIDKSEPSDVVNTENVPEDALLQSEIKSIDFEKMCDLDQVIFFERARLLNLQLPKKKCNDSSVKADWNQLTQKDKSKLRMKRLREQESEEEHEYRKFRRRIHNMKSRLLLKLKNFENETFLKEMNRGAYDKIKQKRLLLKSNETPDQQAFRKNKVNLARRRIFLRNKVFKTPEDLLREKETRKRYLERSFSRRSEEQRNAKRTNSTIRDRERRKENKKEWLKIQKTIKGKSIEDAN